MSLSGVPLPRKRGHVQGFRTRGRTPLIAGRSGLGLLRDLRSPRRARCSGFASSHISRRGARGSRALTDPSRLARMPKAFLLGLSARLALARSLGLGAAAGAARLGLARVRDRDLVALRDELLALLLEKRVELRRALPQGREVGERGLGAAEREVATVVVVYQHELASSVAVRVHELDLRKAAPGELLQAGGLDALPVRGGAGCLGGGTRQHGPQ